MYHTFQIILSLFLRRFLIYFHSLTRSVVHSFLVFLCDVMCVSQAVAMRSAVHGLIFVALRLVSVVYAAPTICVIEEHLWTPPASGECIGIPNQFAAYTTESCDLYFVGTPQEASYIRSYDPSNPSSYNLIEYNAVWHYIPLPPRLAPSSLRDSDGVTRCGESRRCAVVKP